MPNLSRRNAAFLLMAVAGFLLAARPQLGLWHDGTLYFGQVLLHSRVPALAQDMFFASGSQDRYSAYAYCLAPLYRLFGEGATHTAGVLLSWALMGAAVWALLTQWAGASRATLFGLLAFAVMSPIYGGGWAFSYSEQFLTARSVAEPLLLWSLVALLKSRFKTMAGLLAAATLFHPLMSLPVLLVAGGYLMQQDRRWLWALVSVPAALLAGAAGLPPWDGLFRRYDPYWWSLFDTVSPQVVLGNWVALDWMSVMLDLGVLLAAAQLRAADDWKRLLRAVISVTLALFAVALVLGDGLRLVLITQMQLWRVHWLTHLLAIAIGPWLVVHLWRRAGGWPVVACALMLALLNVHVRGMHALATGGLLMFALLLAWRGRNVSPALTRLACGVVLLAIVALSVVRLNEMLALQGWQHPRAGWGAQAMLFLSFPTMALAGFAGLVALTQRGRRGAIAAGLSSAALLGAAAATWDQKTDLARAIEAVSPAHHPFAAHLPAQATVYWPQQLAATWGLLERRSHYAPQQGSGMLFNRNNAMAFGARRELYRRIDEDRAACRHGAMLAQDREALTSCDVPALDRLGALCRSLDAPDAMVLPERLVIPPLATWQPTARHDPPQTFALYSCTQLAAPQP